MAYCTPTSAHKSYHGIDIDIRVLASFARAPSRSVLLDRRPRGHSAFCVRRAPPKCMHTQDIGTHHRTLPSPTNTRLPETEARARECPARTITHETKISPQHIVPVCPLRCPAEAASSRARPQRGRKGRSPLSHTQAAPPLPLRRRTTGWTHDGCVGGRYSAVEDVSSSGHACLAKVC